MAAATTCFICSMNIDYKANNPQFRSFNHKTESVIRQVLEIPKSDNVAPWLTLGQAGFCDDCMGAFRKIETMNKIISEDTIVLQAKLKKHCEDRRQKRSVVPFGPLDEIRDKIVGELKSTLRMTTLTKPLEGRLGHSMPVQKSDKKVVNGQHQIPTVNSVSFTNNLDSGRIPIEITLEDSNDSGKEQSCTCNRRARRTQSSTSQLSSASNTDASQESLVGFGSVSLEVPQAVLTLNSRSQVVEPMPSTSHGSGTPHLSSSIFDSSNVQSGSKRQSFNLAQSNKRFRRPLSTDELKRILEYMAESVKNGELEEPNVDVYYTGLIVALKIPNCSPSIIKAKIYNVRLDYIKREHGRLLSTPQPPTGVSFLSSAQIESNTLFPYSRAVWGDDLDISNAQAQINNVLNNTI